MDLKKVDPALELIKDFGKVTHGSPAMIEQMRQKTIFSDGIVPQKFKILAAIIWAISVKCEPCFKYYIQKSISIGATEAELGEFLGIASTMGGCVGEMWALKAFKAFKDFSSGTTTPSTGETSSSDDPSCCQV